MCPHPTDHPLPAPSCSWIYWADCLCSTLWLSASNPFKSQISYLICLCFSGLDATCLQSCCISSHIFYNTSLDMSYWFRSLFFNTLLPFSSSLLNFTLTNHEKPAEIFPLLGFFLMFPGTSSLSTVCLIFLTYLLTRACHGGSDISKISDPYCNMSEYVTNARYGQSFGRWKLLISGNSDHRAYLAVKASLLAASSQGLAWWIFPVWSTQLLGEHTCACLFNMKLLLRHGTAGLVKGMPVIFLVF